LAQFKTYNDRKYYGLKPKKDGLKIA